MINFILKKLIAIISKELYTQENFDIKPMQDWLFSSFRSNGFKNYKTMRKRYLVDMLILENDMGERKELQGRIKEIDALSQNILKEVERRKEIKKKQEIISKEKGVF